MNWFWDLASDDDSRRCIAASMIVKYVAETQKKVETANTMSVDGDYTLKRLVRGLSSSRDSARQGFSACLCQFLAVFPNVDITEVLNLLDETTKVYNAFLICKGVPNIIHIEHWGNAWI